MCSYNDDGHYHTSQSPYIINDNNNYRIHIIALTDDRDYVNLYTGHMKSKAATVATIFYYISTHTSIVLTSFH